MMNTYSNKILYLAFLLFYSLFISSCVYFNTFYNTENSFEQAIEIIENNSSISYKENSEIPKTAKKLLYESILSADIIINEHSDSKYVDDAIYYIARSYFSLNEFYKSEKYFNKLINEFPNTQYYDEAKLWLEYTHLRLGLLDLVKENIIHIENNFKEREKKISDDLFFLLYNLKGDLLIKLKEYDTAFIEFEKSLKFIKSKSKKTMLYSKLAYICESENRLNQAVNYLEKIEILSNNQETKIQSFRTRLDIMSKLNMHNQNIFEFEQRINSSDFESEKLQDEFSLKLSISYMKIEKFNESKEIFNNIINSTKQKKIKCEAYYWLGYISLINEFDLDLALEYFDLVIETMRSSEFSKKVKIYIEENDSYNAILEEYEFLIKNDNSDKLEEDINQNQNDIPMPIDVLDNANYRDSLLFIIAEKLYFDFNQSDLSIDKYRELIQKYPNSIYSSRSQKIINQLLGDSFLYNNQIDSLKFLRDLAWDEFNIQKTQGIDAFHSIIYKYDDFYSYYSLAIIYEDHMHIADSSIYYYNKSLEKCNDQNLKNNLKNKLLLIEESINDSISFFNQNLAHFKGVSFIFDEFNLDSAKFYIKSDELNNMITDYQTLSNDLDLSVLNDSILNADWNHQKYDKESIDSILFKLANISFWFFKDKELSQKYLDIILVNKESSYYDLSKYMINLEQGTNIIDSLEREFELYKNQSNKYIDKYSDNNLEKRCKDNLIIYNNLLNYFPDKNNNEVIDTISQLDKEVIIDKKININSDILPNLNKEKKIND